MKQKLIDEQFVRVLISLLVGAVHPGMTFGDVNQVIGRLQRLPDAPPPTPRGADMGEVQVWAGEVEAAIADAAPQSGQNDA
jgi:hypothetical protein